MIPMKSSRIKGCVGDLGISGNARQNSYCYSGCYVWTVVTYDPRLTVFGRCESSRIERMIFIAIDSHF